MTENEAAALERIYVNDEDKTLMDYCVFVHEINLVFTKPGLEKTPLDRIQPWKVPKLVDHSQTLTQTESDRLHRILTELGEYVRINRVLLKPFMKDSDITNSGKIKFTRFRSIMNQCNIQLTDEAYEDLCKMFSYQGIEFNYVQFDEVLKQYANENN